MSDDTKCLWRIEKMTKNLKKLCKNYGKYGVKKYGKKNGLKNI